MALPDDAPSPRLCHLIKWPDFDGYGFNLHAEKEKLGQFIGKVDEDSPALLAGLREGDRIVEVNFVNISNENHRQVVERIKSIANETRLLVVDSDADRWYKTRKLVIKSSQPNVIYFRTPVPQPEEVGLLPIPSSPDLALRNRMNLPPSSTPTSTALSSSSNVNGEGQIPAQSNGNSEHDQQNNNSETTVVTTPETPSASSEFAEPSLPRPPSALSNGSANLVINAGASDTAIHSTPVSIKATSPEESSISIQSSSTSGSHHEYNQSPKSTHSGLSESRSLASAGSHNSLNQQQHPHHLSSSSISASASASPSPRPPISTGDPEFDMSLNMTASEMRQLIASRKKKDAKKANLDLREKYEMIQQM